MNKRAIGAIIVVLMVVVVAVAGFYLTRADSGNIHYTTVNVGLQNEAIKEGRIDGGVLWDPYASQAVLEGNAEALIWSGDFWEDHPCCVIVVDNGFAEKNPQAVVAFLAGQIKALAWIQNALDNPDSEDYDALVDIVYGHSNVTEETMLESLKHMDFQIEMNNDVGEGKMGFDDWLEYYTEQFIDLKILLEKDLKNAGYSTVEEFISDLVNADYLDQAQNLDESFALEEPVSIRVGQLAGDLHQLALVVSMDARAGNGSQSILEQMNIRAVTNAPYGAGGNIMTAFLGDELDIAYVGSPPCIQSALKNAGSIDVSIIACANVNGSALIVKKGMLDENLTLEEKILALDGKTIGEPGPSSIQHLLLLSIAKEYGMSVSAA